MISIKDILIKELTFTRQIMDDERNIDEAKFVN